MTAYELLPAVLRIRDADLGYPLRSLLAVVEEEWERLGEDVDGLYDNWFIETCDEWVVPYLGDLLGVQGLAPVPGGVATERALVANTIAYRRRKGTAAVLEQLARDVTGWPARVVEYFQLLGTTQHVDHVRLSNVRTPDLRDAGRLELIGSPFDTAAHSADVRHIDVRRGRHNIPHIGLHLWRLAAYALSTVDARAIDAAQGRWTFDPAGRDLPLFNRPRTETEVTHLAEEVNVPGPLRRRALHEELSALRDTGRPPVFLAEPVPALRIRLAGEPEPADPARLVCCDLTDWHRPDPGEVAVDPLLGRLTLPTGPAPARVQVDFAYGFPGDLGAGPYDRRAALADALAAARIGSPAEVSWQRGVARDMTPVPGEIVASLGEAVDAWNTRPDPEPGDLGVIAVMDSATYDEDLSVTMPPGTRLLIVAASWPDRPDPEHPGVRVRDTGTFVATGLRPHLVGSIAVEGQPGAAAADSAFVLDGLSVEGSVAALPGDLAGLVLANCTVLTDRDATLADGGLVVATDNPHLTVRMLRSICTQVLLSGVPGLGITDCVVHVDGDVDAVAVAAEDAHVEIEACTLLGRTLARSLAASNAILRGVVAVTRRQQGCVRFSFLPLESRAPRRHRCHPVDETAARSVAPRFTSIRPADPGFGQLASGCPVEILTGADDEGEMGAFHFLQQHRRLANLASQLDQYLRFGLEAGVFLAT
ncbi:MAG TPA: phage tail protein [Pilimelia sp.]|nr:phage tail protein [Pilimelia sp.]